MNGKSLTRAYSTGVLWTGRQARPDNHQNIGLFYEILEVTAVLNMIGKYSIA